MVLIRPRRCSVVSDRGCAPLRSLCHQAPEEVAVALQRLPQLLGRWLVAALPALLEVVAGMGEHLGDLARDLPDQVVGLPDAVAGPVGGAPPPLVPPPLGDDAP